MPRSEPYVPESVGEIIELLGVMMLSSPKFVHKTSYFPHANIDTVFRQLGGGLWLTRERLGEDRYFELSKMSDRMRAHFEADPEDKTDDSHEGRAVIREMMDLLRREE